MIHMHSACKKGMVAHGKRWTVSISQPQEFAIGLHCGILHCGILHCGDSAASNATLRLSKDTCHLCQTCASQRRGKKCTEFQHCLNTTKSINEGVAACRSKDSKVGMKMSSLMQNAATLVIVGMLTVGQGLLRTVHT